MPLYAHSPLNLDCLFAYAVIVLLMAETNIQFRLGSSLCFSFNCDYYNTRVVDVVSMPFWYFMPTNFLARSVFIDSFSVYTGGCHFVPHSLHLKSTTKFCSMYSLPLNLNIFCSSFAFPGG